MSPLVGGSQGPTPYLTPHPLDATRYRRTLRDSCRPPSYLRTHHECQLDGRDANLKTAGAMKRYLPGKIISGGMDAVTAILTADGACSRGRQRFSMANSVRLANCRRLRRIAAGWPYWLS